MVVGEVPYVKDADVIRHTVASVVGFAALGSVEKGREMYWVTSQFHD
jgi:hypothetical protein